MKNILRKLKIMLFYRNLTIHQKVFLYLKEFSQMEDNAGDTINTNTLKQLYKNASEICFMKYGFNIAFKDVTSFLSSDK